MALIPDEAIDRMYTELTSGARDLYIFLCRCRNQSNGKCCPSVSTTQDALKLSRARVFALRKELATKGWAEFDGNNAIQLFGFASLKNKTVHELAKEDTPPTPESLENKTTDAEESQKQDSPSLENKTDNVKAAEVMGFPVKSLENKTVAAEEAESLENKTESLKNKTKKSQKLDLHIGRTSKGNQQRRTSKVADAIAPPGSLSPKDCYSLFCELRGTVGGYEAPYQTQKHDFVHLAKLFKNCSATNWALTPERFTQAAKNYFATPRSAHTLADLAVNFSEFYKNPHNEFGRPATGQNGRASPGSNGTVEYVTPPVVSAPADYFKPKHVEKVAE